MGKIVKRNLPCLSPLCGSHDARQVYEDGDSFCFSCREFFPPEGSAPVNDITPPKKRAGVSAADVKEFPTVALKDRKISKTACEFFGVKVSYGENGAVEKHYYPYAGAAAYKVRTVATKEFSWINHKPSLFGKELFAGGGRRLIITEGEIDCLSVAQTSLDKYGKVYPVVALPSASATNLLLQEREWIRSFKEVVLALDMDEPGKEATIAAAKIIGVDKVKIAELSEKDANKVLQEKGSEQLLSELFNAKNFVPSGVLGKDALWEALLEYNKKQSVPYPAFFGGVNEKTKGIRTGEITLFTSGTSCGKSTTIREIALFLSSSGVLPDPYTKIGIVALEESPAETARKLAGMAIKKNPAEEELGLEDLKKGFDQVFADDRFMLLDHQGSIKDNNLMDKLEYMALSGCKYIFIDHITILVSEGSEGLTGNEAVDKVMNELLGFVKRHDVWIGLVSHLRKTPTNGVPFEQGRMATLDDIKGSGSIKQISFDIIAFARNLMEDDPVIRNTIRIAVLKCRFTGLTGSAGAAYYDYKSGRMCNVEDAPIEGFSTVG
jgi:twinkle protein